MDWIDLGQDKDQGRALMNMIMNFGFHKVLEHFLVAAQPAASQEGFSYMKLVSYVYFCSNYYKVHTIFTCMYQEYLKKVSI
jgi:hypothetical protein